MLLVIVSLLFALFPWNISHIGDHNHENIHELHENMKLSTLINQDNANVCVSWAWPCREPLRHNTTLINQDNANVMFHNQAAASQHCVCVWWHFRGGILPGWGLSIQTQRKCHREYFINFYFKNSNISKQKLYHLVADEMEYQIVQFGVHPAFQALVAAD